MSFSYDSYLCFGFPVDYSSEENSLYMRIISGELNINLRKTYPNINYVYTGASEATKPLTPIIHIRDSLSMVDIASQYGIARVSIIHIGNWIENLKDFAENYNYFDPKINWYLAISVIG